MPKTVAISNDTIIIETLFRFLSMLVSVGDFGGVGAGTGAGVTFDNLLVVRGSNDDGVVGLSIMIVCRLLFAVEKINLAVLDLVVGIDVEFIVVVEVVGIDVVVEVDVEVADVIVFCIVEEIVV